MNKNIYSEDYKKIVGLLKKARVSARLSQIQAARLLGRTQSYISKVESGQLKLDIFQLKDFARIYKKTINAFLK